MVRAPASVKISFPPKHIPPFPSSPKGVSTSFLGRGVLSSLFRQFPCHKRALEHTYIQLVSIAAWWICQRRWRGLDVLARLVFFAPRFALALAIVVVLSPPSQNLATALASRSCSMLRSMWILDVAPGFCISMNIIERALHDNIIGGSLLAIVLWSSCDSILYLAD